MAALVRAAERAERTGAPGPGGSSYARAAELVPAPAEAGAGRGGRAAVGMIWERAAEAADRQRRLGRRP